MGPGRVLQLVVDDPEQESPPTGAAPNQESAERDDDVVHLFAVRHLRRDGTQLRVRVVGEIDMYTAPTLAAALDLAVRGAVEGGTFPEIVVDLRSVTFLGAAGLHELLNAQRRCGRAGLTLRVVADQSVVTTPLCLAGLSLTLGLRPTTRSRAQV